MFFKPGQHLTSLMHKHLIQLRISASTAAFLNLLQKEGLGILNPLLVLSNRINTGKEAAGNSCVSAHVSHLLQQQHLETLFRRRYGCAQAGRTSSNHNKIPGLGFFPKTSTQRTQDETGQNQPSS